MGLSRKWMHGIGFDGFVLLWHASLGLRQCGLAQSAARNACNAADSAPDIEAPYTHRQDSAHRLLSQPTLHILLPSVPCPAVQWLGIETERFLCLFLLPRSSMAGRINLSGLLPGSSSWRNKKWSAPVSDKVDCTVQAESVRADGAASPTPGTRRTGPPRELLGFGCQVWSALHRPCTVWVALMGWCARKSAWDWCTSTQGCPCAGQPTALRCGIRVCSARSGAQLEARPAQFTRLACSLATLPTEVLHLHRQPDHPPLHRGRDVAREWGCCLALCAVGHISACSREHLALEQAALACAA